MDPVSSIYIYIYTHPSHPRAKTLARVWSQASHDADARHVILLHLRDKCFIDTTERRRAQHGSERQEMCSN
eukprot:4413023-Amphidinium_carterae.1